jgi:hypothetical protein
MSPPHHTFTFTAIHGDRSFSDSGVRATDYAILSHSRVEKRAASSNGQWRRRRISKLEGLIWQMIPGTVVGAAPCILTPGGHMIRTLFCVFLLVYYGSQTADLLVPSKWLLISANLVIPICHPISISGRKFHCHPSPPSNRDTLQISVV